MRLFARALVLLLCCAALSAAGQRTFQGLRLEEALRRLQRAGLPIVFSSEVVKPDMRVAGEPRAATPRQQLDELLAAHGLKAETGPRGLILIVADRSTGDRGASRRARSTTRSGAAQPAASSGAQDDVQYTDRVTVWGFGRQPIDGGSAEATLDSDTLRAASSVLAGDGLDAVRAMPRVVAADDFRSEFSVRGSPYRQVGIVVDGVGTTWLQHAVYGRSDAGSLSMFAGDIVDRVTLQAGAYPRRYQDALGAQLEVTLKEGSRDLTRMAARAGGTSAALVAEGPIGSDRRGSWIAGVRNSYRSWPPRRLSENDVGFAFADAHAKLVYDISTTQQVSVTVLGGRSTSDTVDDPLAGPLGNGTDRAALLTAGWRTTLGSRTVVRQRVFFIDRELVSTLTAGQLSGRSSNRAFGYRGEALHAIGGGLLDAGAEVSGMAGARDAFRAAWTTHAAYVNFGRAAPRGLWIEGGARVSDSTLVRRRALAPWILASWRFRPGSTVNASAGASRQFPEADAVLGAAGSSSLLPERATQADVGVEHRRAGILWKATLFSRWENDVLQIDPASPGRYRNSVDGSSRGVELVVAPDTTARFSGWMSYTYARARQTDVGTTETFWSDVDRRHALNAAGAFRLGKQTSVGLVVRAASGAPIPGYFQVTDGQLFAGDRRNVVRLPPYARVDARVQRTFFSAGHAVTVFAEILNALNRQNQALADGIVDPVTGRAAGFSRQLIPRKASVGIEIRLR